VELRSASFSVLEGDGHVFLRRRHRLAGHGRATEVVAFGVRDAPLTSLLANDEEPLTFAGQGEEGVGAGGDFEGADLEIGCGDESGGGVRTGAPDFTVGDDVGADGAAFEAGGAVVDCDGFAVQGDIGCGGRAGRGFGASLE